MSNAYSNPPEAEIYVNLLDDDDINLDDFEAKKGQNEDSEDENESIVSAVATKTSNKLADMLVDPFVQLEQEFGLQDATRNNMKGFKTNRKLASNLLSMKPGSYLTLDRRAAKKGTVHNFFQ